MLLSSDTNWLSEFLFHISYHKEPGKKGQQEWIRFAYNSTLSEFSLIMKYILIWRPRSKHFWIANNTIFYFSDCFLSYQARSGRWLWRYLPKIGKRWVNLRKYVQFCFILEKTNKINVSHLFNLKRKKKSKESNFVRFFRTEPNWKYLLRLNNLYRRIWTLCGS